MFCYFISLSSEILCYIFIISNIFKNIEKITTYILSNCISIYIINILRNKFRFLCSS